MNTSPVFQDVLINMPGSCKSGDAIFVAKYRLMRFFRLFKADYIVSL